MLTKTDGRQIQNSDVAAMAVNNNAANQLATAINQNSGVYDISAGQVIAGVKIPTSLSVSVKSITGSGAVSKTINLFNNTLFGEVVTNNGSGANSIITTFGDANSGKTYAQLMAIANNGNGINIKGFTVKAKVNSTGAAAPEFFTTANLKVLLDTLKGDKIPFEIDLDEASRNTQFKSGELTLFCPIQLNALMQLVFEQGTDILTSWTFFTDASTFKG